MNHLESLSAIAAQWYLPFFATLWFGISGLLSLVGGWSSLAKQFRATQPPSGSRFRFVSGSLGARFLPVSYRSCLFITVNDAGLHLSILFPFRLLSPPLFISWTQVTSVMAKRFLFVPYAEICFRGHWARLCVRGAAGRRILELDEQRSLQLQHQLRR